MTKRENLLKALRRENPEWVPYDFVPCPSILEQLKETFGTYDYRGHFDIPLRDVHLNPTKKTYDFSIYYDKLPDHVEPLSWAAEWGVMGENGSVAHFQKMIHPMSNFESIKEIEEYPFPDYTEDYRWDGMAENVKKLVENDLVTVANMQMTIFETSWYLRGLDDFLVDMITDTDFAEALMDKITDIREKMAARYAGAGVDILQLGDDVATQLDMMISPDSWRSLIKPRMARVIKAAKIVKPNILVYYHSDGNILKIIPDLIEIGVDILNPVQPECMNPIEIKKLYGDKLSFWGALGTQTTLPFGTTAEVKETCKMLIEGIGKNGGFLLAPTHVVEPEVPIENLTAFIEAAREYGNY